jgi:ATP-dependent helicase/nuclease subunit B
LFSACPEGSIDIARTGTRARSKGNAMSVTFVIGRAGSGKTRWCFDAIVKALRDDPLGPPIYWMLPRQATFDAQRDLACTSGLSGFCRARIVSFSEFGREVTESCGGNSIPEITPLGRQMILGHLLRALEPRLQLFGGSARRVGLAAQLDQTFTELEKNGKGSDELAAMISEVEKNAAGSIDGSFLLAKLRDIALVYEEYNRYLGQERLDQQRRANRVRASIADCRFLREAMVFVDGFLEFDENDRQLLVAMAKVVKRMDICLLINPGSRILQMPRESPDELSLFHRPEQAYRRLFLALADAGVEIAPPMFLRDKPRFEGSPTLALVERSFDEKLPPTAECPGIEFIEASDHRPEADAVAQRIRALAASGLRYREITVITRNLETYAAALAESFAEHGIPFFIDRRRSATHHPLLRALRSILQIARFDWPTEAALALMKTGLAGVENSQADAVENYLLGHFIRGAKGWCDVEPWENERPIPVDEDDPQIVGHSVDQIRRELVNKLSPAVNRLRSAPELPLRTIAGDIFAAFDALGVQKTVESWMATAGDEENLEQAAEHQRVWDELVDLFNQMVDLLGETTMSLERFSEVLESGLEEFDLALTPPTVDQVLIGQIDRTRTPRVRAAFVMGLSAGEFPATPADGSILSSRERRELARLNIELDPDTRRRAFDERLLGYIAFTRASEKLYLSRTVSEAGRTSAAPSMFWSNARALFPQAPLHTAQPAAEVKPSQIGTPRQLVTSLLHWARNPAGKNLGDADGQTWRSLYQWLATRNVQDDAIDTIRHRAWSALSYANKAELSPATRGLLFPSPMTVTASQLETFAQCPFSHFARYGLRLRQRQRQEVGRADLAGLYSQKLNKLIGRAIQSRQVWDGPEAPIDSEAVDDCLSEVDDLLTTHLARSGGRGRYLLARTRKILVEFLEGQRQWMQRSRFRPAFSEVRFGSGERLPALQVTSTRGTQLSVQGRIDRVDQLQGGQDVCVMSYRMYAGKLSLDAVRNGLSLKLLTGLLAVQAGGKALSGKPLGAAGAFVLQVPRVFEDVKHPDEATPPDDPEFHLAAKARGVFSVRRLGQLDTDLQTGFSPVVAARVNVDGKLGSPASSDVADEAEFAALLKFVERQLGELADQISAGDVAIAPYRMGSKSPCAHCDFKSVCRFHVRDNRYRHLESAGRIGVLALLREGSDGK